MDSHKRGFSWKNSWLATQFLHDDFDIDRIAIVVALAAFLIRVGNFFNHEMIGHPTDLPWAVIFTERDLLPRHPSQLYEAVCYILTFVLMRFIYNRYDAKTPNGLLLGVFFICVFGARFAIEFTKENQVAFENGLPFNMGQILSVPLVALGAFLMWRSLAHPVITPDKPIRAASTKPNGKLSHPSDDEPFCDSDSVGGPHQLRREHDELPLSRSRRDQPPDALLSRGFSVAAEVRRRLLRLTRGAPPPHVGGSQRAPDPSIPRRRCSRRSSACGIGRHDRGNLPCRSRS